jgi:hypothetical protein
VLMRSLLPDYYCALEPGVTLAIAVVLHN